MNCGSSWSLNHFNGFCFSSSSITHFGRRFPTVTVRGSLRFTWSLDGRTLLPLLLHWTSDGVVPETGEFFCANICCLNIDGSRANDLLELWPNPRQRPVGFRASETGSRPARRLVEASHSPQVVPFSPTATKRFVHLFSLSRTWKGFVGCLDCFWNSLSFSQRCLLSRLCALPADEEVDN